MTRERATAVHLSVAEIIADPQTPSWIKDGVQRLRKSDPIYSAFLEALHDMRVGASVYAREN
jgi:hypothetical protein